MPLEIEQKFPVDSLDTARQALAAHGAKFETALNQVDLYFAHPSRDFGQTDEALRLRRVGEENCITYKGPKLDLQTKTRQEIELPLAGGKRSFEESAELLKALGFHPTREVCKSRQPGVIRWEGREVHLALDEVEGLGTYLELEIVAEESLREAAKGCILSLAKKLGLRQVERRGYLEMLLGREDGKQAGN